MNAQLRTKDCFTIQKNVSASEFVKLLKNDCIVQWFVKL